MPSSRVGMWLAKIGLPQVVRSPLVSSKSLMPSGSPCSAGSGSARMVFSSAARAVARAASISIAVIAFTAGLMAAIRPMQLSSSSAAESVFAPIMRRASMAVRSQGSVM